VPIDYEFGDETVAYPQCHRLAERICSGTCDCKKTKRGRVVWFTSVHLACYYGQLEVVKWLMRFYQNVDPLKEKALLTPLMVSFFSIQLYMYAYVNDADKEISRYSYVFGHARLFKQYSFRLSSFYLRKISFISAASV